MDPDKLACVRSWPAPVKLKKVRAFVGLCSYYRRYIQGFSLIARPLHALTKKNARFEWSLECQAAFQCLKEKLTTAPIIALPRDEGTFTLDTDASKYSIGAVLSQNQDGEERVVAYGSRLYSQAESNYCTTRQELLAIVYFVRQFKQYLLGRKFLIRTDHAALQWLKRTPEPVGQQSRWLEQLAAYDFDIIHRAGVRHSNDDALSRIPCHQCGWTEVSAIQEVTTTEPEPDLTNLWSPIQLARLQSEDTDFREFVAMKLSFQDVKPQCSDVAASSEDTKLLWSM